VAAKGNQVRAVQRVGEICAEYLPHIAGDHAACTEIDPRAGERRDRQIF
jgi:hypothetical protein